MKFPLLPLLCVSLTFARGADAPPKTLLAECGKILFSDELSQTADAKVWHAAKGKWEAADGALRGAELAADKHGAVTRHQLEFKDAVIQFDLKLDGAKSTSLSLNDAKGHVARVAFNATGFTVQKDVTITRGPTRRRCLAGAR